MMLKRKVKYGEKVLILEEKLRSLELRRAILFSNLCYLESITDSSLTFSTFNYLSNKRNEITDLINSQDKEKDRLIDEIIDEKHAEDEARREARKNKAVSIMFFSIMAFFVLGFLASYWGLI